AYEDCARRPSTTPMRTVLDAYEDCARRL
ncbi:hypothetical protein A2U01_0094870, partial [Trifolium medium]|nr:hypothetical protein [Trifolium medium]